MARQPRIRNHAIRQWRRALIRDRRAATAIEYGLILALVALVIMSALIGVADVTTNMWGDINSKVQQAH